MSDAEVAALEHLEVPALHAADALRKVQAPVSGATEPGPSPTANPDEPYAPEVKALFKFLRRKLVLEQPSFHEDYRVTDLVIEPGSPRLSLALQRASAIAHESPAFEGIVLHLVHDPAGAERHYARLGKLALVVDSPPRLPIPGSGAWSFGSSCTRLRESSPVRGASCPRVEATVRRRIHTGGITGSAVRNSPSGRLVSNCNALAPSRRAAISTATGLVSDPMKRRPSLPATTSVVPLPHIGSHTSAPALLDRRMMRSSSRSGFCVGYPVPSDRIGVLATIAGISFHTLPSRRPSSA